MEKFDGTLSSDFGAHVHSWMLGYQLIAQLRHLLVDTAANQIERYVQVIIGDESITLIHSLGIVQKYLGIADNREIIALVLICHLTLGTPFLVIIACTRRRKKVLEGSSRLIFLAIPSGMALDVVPKVSVRTAERVAHTIVTVVELGVYLIISLKLI